MLHPPVTAAGAEMGAGAGVGTPAPVSYPPPGKTCSLPDSRGAVASSSGNLHQLTLSPGQAIGSKASLRDYVLKANILGGALTAGHIDYNTIPVSPPIHPMPSICLHGSSLICDQSIVAHVSPQSALEFKFPTTGVVTEHTGIVTEQDQSDAFECRHGLGWRQARQALLSAGACPHKASEAWVANHYRLVVWKLCSHERMLGATKTGDLSRHIGVSVTCGILGAPQSNANSVPSGDRALSQTDPVDLDLGAVDLDMVLPRSALTLSGLRWEEVIRQLQYR